jgi:hypothetical protein
MRECRVLSPNGILGYGFPEESFMNGISKKPDLIAADGGSSDPGPYYLGSGKSFTNGAFVKRDFRFMLVEGLRLGVPVVLGTAGGSGAAPHLEWMLGIIEEIAREEGLSFTLGVIRSDVPKETVKAALGAGKIRHLSFEHELTEELIETSTNIVAQLGHEPLVAALKGGCQVVVAGRCYDPANFSCLPIMRGFDPGLAIHMGKILECGAIAATPGSGADCVLGTLREDSFILEALNPKRKFTRESASAHTLYEKSDPYHLPGPGGILDLDRCSFADLGDGRVEVRGSVHRRTPRYCLKLEGARMTGYRSMSVAGVRDPVMIAGIDSILKAVVGQVQDMSGGRTRGKVLFHVYGKNGVMGDLEPVKETRSHELGIVMESVAPSQEEADTLISVTRSTLLHYGYPGRISTAGNLAFPFSPSDLQMGEHYEFSIYHLMEIDENPERLFPFQIREFRKGEEAHE